MNLQIGARFRALAHWWGQFRGFRETHEIWRVYRLWGLKTDRVFCSCGEEFTRAPSGAVFATTTAQLIEMIKQRKGVFRG